MACSTLSQAAALDHACLRCAVSKHDFINMVMEWMRTGITVNERLKFLVRKYFKNSHCKYNRYLIRMEYSNSTVQHTNANKDRTH